MNADYKLEQYDHNLLLAEKVINHIFDTINKCDNVLLFTTNSLNKELEKVGIKLPLVIYISANNGSDIYMLNFHVDNEIFTENTTLDTVNGKILIDDFKAQILNQFVDLSNPDFYSEIFRIETKTLADTMKKTHSKIEAIKLNKSLENINQVKTKNKI